MLLSLRLFILLWYAFHKFFEPNSTLHWKRILMFVMVLSVPINNKLQESIAYVTENYN